MPGLTWDGSTLTEALSFPSSFGSTPTKPFAVNIGALPSGDEMPAGAINTVTAEVLVPSSFTGAPWPSTAIAGYIVSANSNSLNSNVALYGFAGIVADNANPYGLDADISNTGAVGTLAGCNCGHSFVFATNELDFHIMKILGGAAPSGTILGLSILGDSEVSPTGYAGAIDVAAMGSNGVAPWSNGVRVRPGAVGAGPAFEADESAWSGAVASAPIKFVSGANGGSEFASLIYATAAGRLELTPGSSGVDVTGNLIATTTVQSAGGILTAAAPTVAAGQIGLGGTTTANTNCGALAGSAGCVVVNVAGTTRYVPFY